MNFTIKNLPAPLHRELKRRAALNHRSLNGEVLDLLEHIIFPHKTDVREIIASLKPIQARQKRDVTMEEIRAGIEEGRR